MPKIIKRQRRNSEDDDCILKIKKNKLSQKEDIQSKENHFDLFETNDKDNLNDKLDLTLGIIKKMTVDIHQLVNQVNNLKEEVQEIKQIVYNKNNVNTNHNTNILSNHDLSLSETTFSNSISSKFSKGPFPKYTSVDRTVPRPSTKELAKSVGGKVHSLQFTSSLYVNLIEKEIGPVSKTGLDYKAMVKEAILITKAVISKIKEEHNIDPELRWSQIDPTVKLNAYRHLEAATEHLLPLKTCSEFWGAHVLISNFWLKRKKTKSPTQNTITLDDDKSYSSPDKTFVNNSISEKRIINACSIPFLTNQ